jgi:hypothetical protein
MKWVVRYDLALGMGHLPEESVLDPGFVRTAFDLDRWNRKHDFRLVVSVMRISSLASSSQDL